MTDYIKHAHRWNHGEQDMYHHPEGDFVLFTDYEDVVAELRSNHERVVGELVEELSTDMKKWKEHYLEEIGTLRTALAASRAEVEGLKSVANHARNLAAWFSSGNSVPVDGVHTMKLSSHPVLHDARLLRNSLAAMEKGNEG
jgi:predicted RNase H-like nuclease (RuvC/YqgF family)